MKDENSMESGKTRQNVSLSPKTKALWKELAKDQDTTMSALLTQWIREKSGESPPIRPLRPSRTHKPKGENTDRA